MTKISELQKENAALHQRISDLESRLAENIVEQRLAEKKFEERKDQFHSLEKTMAQGIVNQDFSARKIAEEAQCEREERYRNTLNSMLEGCQIIGFDWRYLYVNNIAARQGQAEPDDLLNHTMMEVYPGIETTALFAVLRDCMENRVPKRMENQFTFPNGGLGWFELSIQPTDQGIFILSTDITERKKAEEKLRQSEEQYRYVFENNPEPMWAYDLKTLAFLAVNEAAIEKYGYSREEFLKMTIADIRPPDDIYGFMEHIKQPRPALQHSGEWRHRLKNGRLIDVEINSHTVEIGKRDAVLVVARDISERKQAEEALRASEARYQKLVETSESAIAVLNREAVILYSNPRGIQIWNDPQIVGKTVFDIYPLEAAERYHLAIQHAIDTQTGILDEIQSDINGRLLWFRLSMQPLQNADGTVDRLLLNAVDITELKNTEQKIRLANERFTELVDNISDIFWISDPITLETIYVSPAFESITGSSPESVDQLPGGFLNLILPEDRHFLNEAREQERLGLKTDMEYRIRRSDGSILWLRIKGFPVFDENGQVIRVVGVCRDITEQVTAEALLRQSETRFRQLTENIHEVFRIFDHDQQKIVYISPAYETIWGRTCESLLQYSRGYLESILPEDQPIMLGVFQKQANREKSSVEYRILRPDGSIRWIWDRSFPVLDENGRLLLSAGVATDITDRKQAEQENFHRQKLLEKVIQLGKNITISMDLDLCMREIHRSVRLGLGFDRVGLFSYDASRNVVRGVYGTDRTGQIDDNTWYVKQVADWSDWQIALQSPMGMKVDQDYHGTHNPSPESEMFGVKQHITLAAWAGDKPVAMITVDNAISQREIRASDLEALQLFAGYAGLAIENALLNAGLEQRVKERTAEVQDLYDNAPAGYHSMDADGLIVLINQTELTWLGYTQAEIVGCKTFRDLLTPNSQKLLEQKFPKFQIKGSVTGQEFEMIRKDGSILPVLLNAAAIFTAEGKYQQSRVTVFDITEGKRAEQVLRESEERYRSAIRAADAVPYSLDYATESYTFMGEEIERITGYTRDEMTPQLFSSFILDSKMHGDLQGLPAIEATRLARSGQVPVDSIWRNDLKIRNKNGEDRWLSDISLQVFNEKGEISGSLGIVQDITERKLAEEALRESEEQNRLLFEESPDAVTLLDDSGNIIRANRAYEQLTKIPVEEMIGKSAQDLKLVSVETFSNLRSTMGEAIARQENFFTSEYLLSCADGKLRNVESRIYLLIIGGNNHILVTTRDISVHKKAEEVLRQANIEMEKAMRMKDEFLASMSHELRTPLTGILGLSEALQYKTYGELSERQLKAVKNIEASGRHLLELINDILDLSKIEAGKFELRCEPCSLMDVCNASLQLTKGMAQLKQQVVRFSADPAEIVVRADARRLKQMLVNLLSNAIKFTPTGGELGLEVQLAEQENLVRINVWDRGPGILATDLPKLFKPFVQLDSSLSREHSGTGLGLSLVRKLAELQGGSVNVESAVGEGSRFTIVLPWFEKASQPLVANDRNTTSQRLALLIEDNPLDIGQISGYLKNIGIDTISYRPVSGAFEKVAQLRPDVILLDLDLNNSSGLDVLVELKTVEVTRNIPVVTISDEGSHSLTTKLGAVGYLIKPVAESNLRAELVRISLLETGITPVQIQPSVLVVDDNEVILKIMSDFLNGQKFRVTLARSERELLEIGSATHPDLILLDIQMAGINGLETIRRIRSYQDEKLAKTQIIAITALTTSGDGERSLAAGANKCLSKPVNLKNLPVVISELLDRKTPDNERF